MNARKFRRTKHCGQRELTGCNIYLGLVMEAGLLTCAVPYESISETCASMVNISRTDLHEHLQAVLSKYDKLDITDAHTRCAAAFPVICELARRCYAIKDYSRRSGARREARKNQGCSRSSLASIAAKAE